MILVMEWMKNRIILLVIFGYDFEICVRFRDQMQKSQRMRKKMVIDGLKFQTIFWERNYVCESRSRLKIDEMTDLGLAKKVMIGEKHCKLEISLMLKMIRENGMRVGFVMFIQRNTQQ